jgi:hypothetical protein
MKIMKTIFLSASLLVTFTACEDMLDANSDRLVFEEDYVINDPNEAFYALSGVMAEMQAIGDRYVLLGELRGDLMTASEQASVALQEINKFRVSKENEYADKHAYYNIINNCNYILQRMDTSLVLHAQKVMLPAYAQAKAIRAWTYFQMVQIFGKAHYIDKPILDLNASLAAYPVVGLDEMADKLIQDLLPYSDVQAPSSEQAPYPFISTNLMLADLYLYKNDYKIAAQRYYTEIYNLQAIITTSFLSRWFDNTWRGCETYHNWSYSGEAFTGIEFRSQARYPHSRLVNLTVNTHASILPAQQYVDFMNTSIYILTTQANITSPISTWREGDLRGCIKSQYIESSDAFGYINTALSDMPVISKFYIASSFSDDGFDPDNGYIENQLVYLPLIMTYRYPHLYLRLAEALNRDGKPTLAFAVLKYGLNYTTLHNPLFVNPDELNEPYAKFDLEIFAPNVGTAMRGRGYGIYRDQSVFVIPGQDVLPEKQDSIDWVELRILEEMSAETAFEGNRFFDLLRISRRRPNHPEFMAGKVASKYEDAAAMKAELMDINHWFLP